MMAKSVDDRMLEELRLMGADTARIGERLGAPTSTQGVRLAPGGGLRGIDDRVAPIERKRGIDQ